MAKQYLAVVLPGRAAALLMLPFWDAAAACQWALKFAGALAAHNRFKSAANEAVMSAGEAALNEAHSEAALASRCPLMP